MAHTNILQWNCEGIKAKFSAGDIHQLIKETKTTCLCLQETKLKPEAQFKIKGYRAYLQNRDLDYDGQPAHGGVAIYLKNFVSSYRINLQTTLQAVAVSTKIRKRVTICSLYLPPGENVSKEQLQNLIDQLPKPFLLLGDMNAHHTMWHDPRPDRDGRGETIVDLIADNDIALLDKNKMTHMWKVDKTFSHVDLSICSVELLTLFQWDVHEEPLNSDHFPILLNSEVQINQGGEERWIIHKADWDRYKQCTESDQNISDFSSVQEAADFFANHIREAASNSIPKSKGTRKRKSPPWWNERCRAAIWKRKAALRRYRRTTTAANYNKYNKTRAEARRTVKQSKKEAWTNFVNSINHKSTSKDIWRKINMLNNKYKSQCVNTLILNKEVKICNVPSNYKPELIKKLCSLGCVQTLKIQDEETETLSILIRFERDDVTDRALLLHNEEVLGHKLQVGLTINPQDQAGSIPEVLDEPKDIADCFGRRFSHVSSESSGDPRFQDEKQRAETEEVLDFSTSTRPRVCRCRNKCSCMDYNNPITTQELDYALRLAKDSSPGPDEICYSMLRNLAPSGKTLLLELLNRIFTDGKFPDSWKEAYIIPILKEGKPEISAASYRPIALTSCICKLFERILNRRLVRYLEANGYIDKFQSGFRKGRSTIDCLAALTTEAHNAYRRNQYLACIFFDLEKAYDTCWKHLIMRQLHKFGLRGNLPVIIQDFLSNRKFKVKVSNKLSDSFEQEMGVPQGGVLSCTLFSIAINTVVKEITGFTNYSIYVDDKRIAYAHSDPKTCETRLQQTLDALHVWSIKTGFRFSTGKTEWMMFHRGLRELLPGELKLTLDGKVLKEVKTKRFLGVILDRQLMWHDHVKYLRGRCLKALNIIHIIARNSRETDSKTLLRIYRALVRSKLDYACQVYGTAAKTNLLPLDPIHNKGIRLCLGAFQSSPCESMYVEANEPSLKNRRLMLQLQYYARLKQFLPENQPIRLDDASLDGEYARQNTNKPIALGYSVRQSIIKLDIDLPNIALLHQKTAKRLLGPWEFPQPVVCMELAQLSKSNTSEEEYEQRFRQHKHVVDIDLYTDGSKSSEGVGSGVAAISGTLGYIGMKRRLHQSASIFTAELNAVKTALISLKPSANISCAVYSDSRSALQAIKGQSDNTIVQDILELLVLLREKGISVTFCWVPGHSNIAGNEHADKEAKAAVRLPRVSNQVIPLSDVNSYIKQKVKDKVVSDWVRYRHPITRLQPKLKEICPDIRGTPLDLGLSRMDTQKLVRLRLGHTRFTHSHIYTRGDMPWCIECEEPMSVKHILLDCGNWALERYQYYDPREVSLRTLLSKRENAIKALQFLKEIGLYNQI